MHKTSPPRRGNRCNIWTDVALDSNGRVIGYVRLALATHDRSGEDAAYRWEGIPVGGRSPPDRSSARSIFPTAPWKEAEPVTAAAEGIICRRIPARIGSELRLRSRSKLDPALNRSASPRTTLQQTMTHTGIPLEQYLDAASKDIDPPLGRTA